MIDGLKPYPTMKDSGLPWLGQVPEHWECTRLGNLVQHRIKRFNMSDDTPVLSLTINGIRVKKNLHFGKSALSYIGHQLVEPGELVFTPRDFDQTPILAGVAADAGCISNLYFVVTPRTSANIEFINQYLWGLKYKIDYFRQFSEGMRYSFSRSSFSNIPSLCPPLPEQAAIVKYLDYIDRRISRYIRTKQKQIKLLEEQKQAIIHRAVTRGLDPSVPLKPSDIPWLGDIPQHWEMSRIKNEFYCLNTRRVPLNGVERGEMTSRTYDYYGASGIIDKVDDYLFDDELILIAEDGANLVLRNLPLAIIARGKFWVNNHAHILKPKRGNIVYLAQLLETMNYSPWISGAAQPKLTQDRLLSISIAVAPPAEQDGIVRHTLEQTRPLNDAISRLKREIELLHEYRIRLIADVVTGKLDVREAAVRLLDEDEDIVATEDLGVVEGEEEAGIEDGEEILEENE